MKHFSTRIISNRPISEELFKLDVEWISTDQIPQPGNFYTIRVCESCIPFLRRPFAFSWFDAANRIASIIYKKRGAATSILAGKKADEQIDVIGPLGNSFPMCAPEKKAVLVGGGIGLGPILFLARKLKMEAHDYLLIAGFRSKDSIPEKEVFDGLAPIICTDNGSAGYRGTVIDYLHKNYSDNGHPAIIYACGPMPMLNGCYEIAHKHGNDCFISVEQVMACGVGACMGCVIKIKNEPGYARVCSEGPVFDSKDIVWT